MSTVNKAAQVSDYLVKNNLTEVFPLLVYETFLCRARSVVVQEKIIKCRELFADMERYSFSADSVILLQTSQLDLISSLFMLLEDYLSYSHYLNTMKKELLPEKVLSERTVTWNHINYLRNLKNPKVRDYLILPSLKKMALTLEEEKFVTHILKVYVNDIHDRISRISRFFVNYSRVYVRYKHLFSAMVGTYTVQPDGEKPRIFMRDRIESKTKQIERSTYVIPSSIEALAYYEKIKDDIEKVFLSLLEAHIQSMQNCGQSFLMPDAYCIPERDKLRWLVLVRKINFFTGSIPKMNLAINIRQRSVPKMLDVLSSDYIFKLNEDILNTTSNMSVADVKKT